MVSKIVFYEHCSVYLGKCKSQSSPRVRAVFDQQKDGRKGKAVLGRRGRAVLCSVRYIYHPPPAQRGTVIGRRPTDQRKRTFFTVDRTISHAIIIIITFSSPSTWFFLSAQTDQLGGRRRRGGKS